MMLGFYLDWNDPFKHFTFFSVRMLSLETGFICDIALLGFGLFICRAE